jgi:ABC-type phosphate/phosphonate transport system substrate-binding protein
MTRTTKTLLLLLPLLAAAASASAETTMLVYLPAAPVESASRLGEAVTELGSYLGKKVPGLTVSVRPFRRAEDATAYVQASSGDVALVLSEQAFLLDLPAGFSPVPTSRLVRAGKETHRKIVVVGTGDASVQSIADLKGRSLSLALAGGEGVARFLSRAVFDGAVVPESWFGKVLREADEFTATANVLFGKSDAALVSEDNPLAASHVGKDLRIVYTSPALSLPVLACRAGALSPPQQAALEAALEALGRRPEEKPILEGLKIDGFARIKEGAGRLERAGLLSLPGEERRSPEVAVGGLRDLVLPPLPPIAGGKLPFQLGLTLPDLPMPVAPEAGKERKDATTGLP